MQNSGRQSGDWTTILAAKEKKQVELATILVAISSPDFGLAPQTFRLHVVTSSNSLPKGQPHLFIFISPCEYPPMFTECLQQIIVNYYKVTLWVFYNDFSYWPVQYKSSCLVHHHTYPSHIHLALNRMTLTVQDPHIHLSKIHIWHVGKKSNQR